MAALPETDALLLIGDTYSSPSPPPSPVVLPLAQENSSLTTAAPPEPAQLDHTVHTVPIPPLPPEQDTAENPELGVSSPTDGGDQAPSLPPPEAAPAAYPALEAASPEKYVSPSSSPPGAPVEVFLDVSASVASPPPSPQIGDAPPPPSPPPTPPVTTSPRAVLESYTADAVAMASREAASPTPVSELDSHSAPAPLRTRLESGPERLSLQQHPEPAAPAMTPQVCENVEPAQPPPLPAESTYMLSDASADEVAPVDSAEAAGSTVALEAMDVERDTAPDVPLASESVVAGDLPQELPHLPSSEIVPRQISEPAKMPQLPPPPAESTYCSLEALVNEVAAVPSEEAAGSPPTVVATGGEVALESRSEVALQEPMQTSSSPKVEAEACSPDMAPPGFEHFKSKWLPQPAHTLPVESTHYMVEAPVTDTTGVPLHQSIMVPSSLTIEAAPCSPDTPPPGFENFKTSWLPQLTVRPSAEISYLPHVTTKEELVEKSCSVPALDTIDMETGTAQNLLPTLNSGAGGLLEVSDLTSSSPKIQSAPCSPYITPPGSESLTLPQLQLPSPVDQTSHISQDSAATGAASLTSEDVPQTSPVLEAMDVERDTAPVLPTSSENFESMEDAVNTTVTLEAVDHPLSVAEATEEAKGHILPSQLVNGCDGPLTCLEPKVSSPVVQATPCSPEIMPTDFKSLVSSRQTSPCLAERIDSPSHLPFTKYVTVKSEKTAQPLSPLQATDTDMESAPVLQSPLKSEEKSLPHPEHQLSSPSEKDTPCSLDIAPPGYENLDYSEELPPPPPLCPYFEIGQMVCGCCRELIAYPRGATHVQCFCCWTINFVLEEHQVGKVYCGQCETLLMYPFGAPAVRCSNCLFVTEIGERNVRPRMSPEQGTPPVPQELAQA